MNDCVPSSSIRAFLLIENRLLREALVRLFRKRSDLECRWPSFSRLTKCLWASLRLSATSWWAIPSSPSASGQVLLPRAECRPVVELFSLAWSLSEEQFIAAVRSGVTGYLLQDASASDVVATVRAVYRGEAVCPPQLCSVLFRFVAQIAPGDASPRLTT